MVRPLNVSFHTSGSGGQKHSAENQPSQRHAEISLLQTGLWCEPQHPHVCLLSWLVHQHSKAWQQASWDVHGERQTLPNLQHPAPELIPSNDAQSGVWILGSWFIFVISYFVLRVYKLLYVRYFDSYSQLQRYNLNWYTIHHCMREKCKFCNVHLLYVLSTEREMLDIVKIHHKVALLCWLNSTLLFIYHIWAPFWHRVYVKYINIHSVNLLKKIYYIEIMFSNLINII